MTGEMKKVIRFLELIIKNELRGSNITKIYFV